MEKESGVVALRNLKTDKVYLFFSKDIKKDCVDMRFKLDLGMHQTGLEVFRFDTIERTDDEGRLSALSEGLDLYK